MENSTGIIEDALKDISLNPTGTTKDVDDEDFIFNFDFDFDDDEFTGDPIPVRKFAGRVFFKKHREALNFANKYSNRRAEDGVQSMFTDGTASEPRLVQLAASQGEKTNKRWCACAVVYREHPDDEDWVKNGYTMLHIGESTNSELGGLAQCLALAHDLFANDHVVKKIMVFSDSGKMLSRLTKISPESPELPNWDHNLLSDVLAYADLLVNVYEKELELHWVPSHQGVEGNELADETALAYRPDKLWPELYRVNSNSNRRKKDTLQESKRDPVLTPVSKQNRDHGRAMRITKRPTSRTGSFDISRRSKVAGDDHRDGGRSGRRTPSYGSLHSRYPAHSYRSSYDFRSNYESRSRYESRSGYDSTPRLDY
ncbi:hypothetical protein DIS24_g9374 [Lasiodiplodia hormozganensis]|uniref:RNase H type-1 domain-containing protein n=1 Tax=Lasiodiplodia hormozganensis TaxID=869390 RepID=A0AA39XVL0_9PEZI|nr:hypothetical protein DIS24_g9374 [Lasiodiplodia hormozganensis]